MSTLMRRKGAPNVNTRNNANNTNINGNIVDFFQVKSSRNIQWSHATNSSYKLAVAMSNSCHMIEADILMGTCPSHPSKVPIMAHPPFTKSDLSFEDFILSIHNANQALCQHLKKGVKLDFKDPESVVPCLKFLKSTQFDAPVFINADIWRGNGGKKCEFVPKDFFNACKLYTPSAAVSVGWKVGKSIKLLFK